jgi:antitoxin (DNA-binding transcriptional repressor) of toxin-antitoxin stability system
MDRAINASEANKRFSEMLRDVQNGETYVVIFRGRAVARMVPVDRDQERRSVAALLGFLDTLPRRHAGGRSRDDLYP